MKPYRITLYNTAYPEHPVSILCSDLDEAKLKFEIIASEQFDQPVTITLTDTATGSDIDTRKL